MPIIDRSSEAPEQPKKAPHPGVLCVANFPADTGYAWDFIEALYGRIAERLLERGLTTWVAYPAADSHPRALMGTCAKPVQLDVQFRGIRRLFTALRFIRKHNIRIVYFADRPVWHPGYALLRWAGVRRVVVHDHTSGQRTVPTGVKRFLKSVRLVVAPTMLVDAVVAVSEFVAKRKVEVDLVPRNRVHAVRNSIDVPVPNAGAREQLRQVAGLQDQTPIIICACRASPVKGVDYLLRAFDRIQADVALVYMGDGPDLPRLERIRAQLRTPERVVFTGYLRNAAALIEGADICVVPSIWDEAFGLSGLEPLTRGVPVIASDVGGIPEFIHQGETGVLVPPRDEAALAEAIQRLLLDSERRKRLAENGRRWAAEHCSMDKQVDSLCAILTTGLIQQRRVAPARRSEQLA